MGSGVTQPGSARHGTRLRSATPRADHWLDLDTGAAQTRHGGRLRAPHSLSLSQHSLGRRSEAVRRPAQRGAGVTARLDAAAAVPAGRAAGWTEARQTRPVTLASERHAAAMQAVPGGADGGIGTHARLWTVARRTAPPRSAGGGAGAAAERKVPRPGLIAVVSPRAGQSASPFPRPMWTASLLSLPSRPSHDTRDLRPHPPGYRTVYSNRPSRTSARYSAAWSIFRYMPGTCTSDTSQAAAETDTEIKLYLRGLFACDDDKRLGRRPLLLRAGYRQTSPCIIATTD